MYYLLLYDVVDDFVNRRAPYRQEHLKLITEAHQRGELLMQVITFWKSMAAIRRVAGRDLDRAVVDDAARAVLIDCDTCVTHSKILLAKEQISHSLPRGESG